MTVEQTPVQSVPKGIKKKVRTFIVIAILLIALPEIAYVTFRSNTVQTLAIRWLMDQIGQTFNTHIKVEGIDISFFDQITLEKILIEDQSKDTLFYVDELKLQIDSIRLMNRKIHINNIFVQQPKLHMYQDTSSTNFQFILDSIHASPPPDQNSKAWDIQFNNLFVRDAEIRFKKPYADTIYHEGINFNNLDVKGVNLAMVHVKKEKSAISMLLDNASLREKSGFMIKNLTFDAMLDSTGLHLHKFALITGNSNIFSDSLTITQRQSRLLDKLSSVKKTQDLPLAFQYDYKGNLAESIISTADIAYYLPEFWGMDEKVLFSGSMQGTVDNLKFKDLNLRIGQKTSFNADLELKGLPDWQNTYIFLKFYNNTFNFNDFAAIRLPEAFKNLYPKIPSSMMDDVDLNYQGTFSGFPTDFVAYGNLNGELGSLSTDIAIAPSVSGSLRIEGMLDAKSFKLGKFLGFDPLGEVTLHTKIVVNKKDKHFNATINGNIDSIYYNNNRIDSIYLDGTASNKSYNGQLTINDDKIKLQFQGMANLEGKTPVFNFSSLVKTANLNVLGIDQIHKDATCSFDMEANFTGKNIDELDGSIDLKKMKLSRDGKDFNIKTLKLNTSNTSERNTITLRSDIADVDIVGKYRFLEFGLTVRDYLQFYLPSADLPFSKEGTAGSNIFNFNVNLKKPELITYFYFPDIVPESPIVMSGDINSMRKSLNFNCSAGKLSYQNYHSKGLSFSSSNEGNRWNLKLATEEAALGENYRIENVTLNNTLFSDTLLTSFAWGKRTEKDYSGKIDVEGLFSKNDEGLRMADFIIKPSDILVHDTLWQFEKSKIHIDSTKIVVDNFNLHHGNGFFRIHGQLSDSQADKLKIEVGKINLGFFDLVSKKQIGIEGSLSGETEVADINNSFFMNSSLEIKNFHYDKNYFGDVLFDNIWNKEEKRLYTSIKLQKLDETSLLIRGFYAPTSDSLKYDAQLTNFPVQTIYPFLQSFSSGVGGTGNGTVAITGTFSEPCFIGKVDVTGGRIGIDYTKVAYTFNQPVIFSHDSIVFRKIVLSDSENNKGVFDGYITHRMFGNLKYHMSFVTPRIEALKTTLADNSIFYGEAHCSGDILITGNDDRVKLDVNVKSEDGTSIVIPLETPASAAENNFIRFVRPDTLVNHAQTSRPPAESGSFELNLNLTATPAARIQILFNSSFGDVISGQGSGNFRMVYDKQENFTMFGNYNIYKGDYLFTLQNVIGKKFKLEEGGTITWNGDPYEAIVDLNAVYTTKASIKNLLGDTYKNDNTTRLPVECKINLSHKLLNPVLKFDILFPTADERTRDELQQFISTQDDVNRQMLTLMLIGQFYTPEYIRGRTDTQSNTGALVGATTSEMLSNQLSNWLSQISSNFDVGFNYRPGDQVNTNQMELALSTQIFNDRVTINGNIGNNSSLQTNNSNSVVGEIEVFIKLIKSGKLQLKVYNRANTDMTYDQAPYKQGVGFSYRESFNSFSDLFRRRQIKKPADLKSEEETKGK
ncbi:MAG: translocation/assembly module TamB domain-containing protein [Prolixibacteraceae bacterium]